MAEAWTIKGGTIIDENGLQVCCGANVVEDANLIASAPRLREQVRILREALFAIAGTSANENSEPDRMADALGEIQGIVHRALEAAKEGV